MKMLLRRLMIIRVPFMMLLFLTALFQAAAFAQSAQESIRDDGKIAENTPAMPAGTAADPAEGEPQPAQKAPDPAPGGLETAGIQFPMLRTVGALGLVVCLMAGFYFAAKKYAPQFFTKNASAKNMKVIETLSMGDKRSLSLIEVGDNRFLVGNTPHQINLLAALPNPLSMIPEPDSMRAVPQRSPRNESGTQFRNLYEIERKNPPRQTFNSLPEDIRAKMRQLRASLER
jgi:flagellar biosynthetic protein FliO